jgi:hypothetical protein
MDYSLEEGLSGSRPGNVVVVSTKEKPHYPAENPKDLLQENSLVRRENIKMRIKSEWNS